MADINRSGDIEVNIVDKTTQAPADVNSQGALHVYTNNGPRFDATTGAIALTTTSDNTISSLSFAGQVDAVSVNFNKTGVEISMLADSTEILRISMADLKKSAEHDLGITGVGAAGPGVKFPIGVARSGKHFIFTPPTPFDVDTSFEILGKATRANTNVDAYIVSYRIRQ